MVRNRLRLLAVVAVLVSQLVVVAPMASAVGIVPRLDWAASLSSNENSGFAVALDAAGNSYVAGSFSGTVDFDPGAGTANRTASNTDAFVTKLDADGAFVWVAAFGGTGADEALGVAVDGAGNVTVVGRFTGEVDFDPGAGVSTITAVDGLDGFAVGLDSNGAYVWKEGFGGTGSDSINAVAAAPDGSVFGTGVFAQNASDLVIFGRSSTGSSLWTHVMSGSAYAVGRGIAAHDGAVVVTGEFATTTMDFDPGAGEANLTPDVIDVFVLRLSITGEYDWAVQLGGNNTQAGYAATIGEDGRIGIAGYTYGADQDFDPGVGVHELDGGGESDPFFAVLDIDGGFITAGNISGTLDGFGHGIGFDSEYGILLTGYFLGTVDFDPSAGTSEITSAGLTDSFVARYDPSGALDWANSIGGVSNDKGHGVVVGPGDAAYFAGYFSATADLDPSGGTVERTTGTGNDYYAIKMLEQCQGMDATIVGSAGGDWLSGTSGEDVIVGLGGNDLIGGGGGHDVICGGEGDDKIDGGAGDDLIDGGAGVDAIDHSSASGPVAVDLAAGTAVDPGGSDTVVGVENVFGSAYDDVITGDAGRNTVYGLGGDDTLIGGGSKDRLFGNTGNDVIIGGSGKDRLDGGGGHDDVSGGNGADKIFGGGGNDLLAGGNGDDTVFGNDGNDTLRGGAGDDHLDGGPGAADSANGHADFDTCVAETVTNCEA